MIALVGGGAFMRDAQSRLGDDKLSAMPAYQSTSYHSELGDPEFGLRLGRELAGGRGLINPGNEALGTPHAALPYTGHPGVDWRSAILPAEPKTGRQERVVVRRGDTLMNILLRAGVGRAEAHEAVTTLQEVYDPRRLRIGQLLNIEFREEITDSESFAGLSINLDFRNDIKLAKLQGGDFDVAQVERDLVRESRFAEARVDDSLFMAGKRAGVPDEALMEMIRLFSWDIDFQRDIKAGDAFELVYNTLSDPLGDQSHLEYVSYAKVTVGGEQLTAVRFVHGDGRVGYYDENGHSLRKWLMRTPIDGARMSSGFGKRRHPISGYTRMHKGIDFAAPTGTPIYAAGDGTVVKIGRNGSYGHYIQIRHNGDYSTAYAHLSKYAKGLKRGERVKQGEVIGYVGSTGRSTGPHLHYEVMVNGSQINPLKIKPQKAVKLAGSELAAFQAQRTKILAQRHTDRDFAQR